MQGTAQSKNYYTYCGNDLPLNLVKVLFSDNNSDVFEWN